MTKNVSFDKACLDSARQVAELVISKQHDYGPGNIMSSIIEPNLAIGVRLNDKLARLVNLSQKQDGPKNESLRDTWMDIIGYGLVGLMVHDETFLLPLEKKK